MAVTATWIDAWQLVENDVQLRTRKHVETDAEAGVVRGWLEQSDESSISMKRHVVGLLSFTPETGEEKVGFSYHVGNGVTLSFSVSGAAGASNKYLCSRDKIAIEDHVDGEGWEHQTWQKISKWAMVEGSYYEEALPVEGTAYDDGTVPEE
jgi:hypothetical protein